MPDVAQASQIDLNVKCNIAMPWWLAGCSVLPVRPTQRKQPDRPWEPLQQVRMTQGQVESWPEGHGVAVICGAVSGGLEMLELEAGWVDGASMASIEAKMDASTLDVWRSLWSDGYSEWSPKGGLHVLYRIVNHVVPGNTKIATKPGDRPGTTKTKAETRGEGGYVVVAPSPAACHEWNDRPWMAIAGTPATIPTIDWEARCAIQAAIKTALDESSSPTTTPSGPRLPVARPVGNDLSPADDYNLRIDWANILEPIGWTLHSRNGAGLERLWTRPGKNRGDGHSASTDYMGKPGLYVWSSSADGLPTEEPLSKFFVYAHYRHSGDMSAAARSLREQGFGTPILRSDTSFMGDVITEPLSGEVIASNGSAVKKAPRSLRPYTLTEFGMADVLKTEIEGFFIYVPARKKWMRWDGDVWEADLQAVKIRDKIHESVMELYEQARASSDEKLVKFALSLMTNNKKNALVQHLQTISGSMDDFDVDSNKLNVGNGLLDLKTFELAPHTPEHMVTKMMGASYRPEAQCPRWIEYLDVVLPNEETRDFLQRMAGYTLTGNPVERALAILHGPGGTGKSRFVETMNILMGSYGATAAASLFQSKKDNAGPSNDLNDLRGARLASISELDSDVKMNEALVKRLTGLDRMTSRGLFEENQTWMPQCVIWLATNHLLKVNSDDGAIWGRVKLIKFEQKIAEVAVDDPHILDKFRLEVDGILNWMLEGLKKYRERGLAVPESVQRAVEGYKEDQNDVAQFMNEFIADGRLIKAEGQRMKTSALFIMYREWCNENHQMGLGRIRFYGRMEAMKYKRVKRDGFDCWVDLGHGNAGIMGTF